MKHTVFFVLMAAGLAAAVSAQGWGPMGMDRMNRRSITSETVKVSGKLSIAQGEIALTDGTTTYLVKRLARFVGFIDGLKEGAQVTLEGEAITNPANSGIKILSPSKMTLNGTDYDLSPPAAPLWQGQGFYPNGPMPQGKHHRNQPAPNRGWCW